MNRCIEGFGVTEDPRTLTCALNYYRANFGENMYEKTKTSVKKIDKDVLILWGDKDIALVPESPEYEKEFITGKFEAIHFPDGNHNLFHSHLDECYTAISTYLKG